VGGRPLTSDAAIIDIARRDIAGELVTVMAWPSGRMSVVGIRRGNGIQQYGDGARSAATGEIRGRKARYDLSVWLGVKLVEAGWGAA